MKTRMTIKTVVLVGIFVSSLSMLGIKATPAFAAGAWRLDSLSNPTAAPGAILSYRVELRNFGDTTIPDWGDSKAPETGTGENCTPDAPGAVEANCYRFKAVFPTGLAPKSISGPLLFGFFPGAPPTGFSCEVGSSTIECAVPANEEAELVRPGGQIHLNIFVEVEPSAEGRRTTTFEISGAGAPTVTALDSTVITPDVAQFDVAEFDGQVVDPNGDVFVQSGAHPFGLSTQLEFNSYDHPDKVNNGTLWPVEPVRDVIVDVPPGLVGNPTTVGQCNAVELANGSGADPRPLCSPSSQVGTVNIRIHFGEETYLWGPVPVFNMMPPVGAPARFGFNVAGSPVVLDARLRSASDYGISIVASNISEGFPAQGTELTFWGNPADVSHRSERACSGERPPSFQKGPTCPSGVTPKAFLRLPTSCTKPGQGLDWTAKADSYFHPGVFESNGEPNLSDPNWKTAAFTTHEAPNYPAAPEDRGPERGIEGCETVPVHGTLTTNPTAIDTETSSGLNVHVEVPNEGLENPDGIASSDIKGVKVALPEGMTINPSQADGLGVCSPSQYQSTVLSFFPTPGKGCPDDAKIGSVQVKTPLLEETIPGDVYIAQPYDNPFGSLLALYVVLHEPERGILIKLAGKVETNERTGQITTTFDNLPQQPFSTFDFKFREGARAPLVTPQACGKYQTHAEFTGWSDPSNPITSNSSFEIVRGIGGGPCPTGSLPPFKPGLIAGSVNNRAGAFSPFNVRLFRTDAEQEFTRFSIKLPPGLSGKLAGIPFCSDAAIEASKAKSGEQELTSPSCPKASEVGHSLAGAGVGSVLTYVPGKIYLAGPYNGSALSIAAITAAKVGPFDLGTVVVRQALKVDPETAEVFVDATGSDPIPHIIDGITTHIRDIRAYVDKPEFTLNPTNCTRTSTASTLLGSGLDFASEIDDRPVTVSTPYQAADCAALGFKPKLSLRLKGGTKRAGHPSLKATLKMKPGMANIARAQVTLPKSEFLDQSHIGTVCTRVQYAKDQCPAKSVYGYARAFTPILDEPLQGPVYLRSSEHKLPDLVAGLKSGKIEIDLAGRIDSVDGQIRSTFETVPDAPVSKFILTMQGGKKGLLENSTNLCARPHKAIVEFDGQNGKISDSNPVVKPQCKGKKKRKAAKRRSAR